MCLTLWRPYLMSHPQVPFNVPRVNTGDLHRRSLQMDKQHTKINTFATTRANASCVHTHLSRNPPHCLPEGKTLQGHRQRQPGSDGTYEAKTVPGLTSRPWAPARDLHRSITALCAADRDALLAQVDRDSQFLRDNGLAGGPFPPPQVSPPFPLARELRWSTTSPALGHSRRGR